MILAAISIVNLGSPATPLMAQLLPDSTLGNENSVVSPNVSVRDTLADLIEGGAIRDSNLFHSFLEFNVAPEQTVYFSNPEGISQILTRVTGDNFSEILGTLGVNGNADLFLINPNGIVFGSDARLDVSGSFIGSTANGVLFDNNWIYSTNNPEAPPLLTINIPIGLQYGSNPGTILVQGNGHNLREDPNTRAFILETEFTGLSVASGETLALIGGEVVLDGGNLQVESGRVELGSVGDNSIVSLTPIDSGWLMGYEEVNSFQDVRLFQAASVNTSGVSRGDIRVQGQRISLTEGSLMLISNSGDEFGGNLTVNGTELVELAGVTNDTGSGLVTRTLATGDAANITIKTARLKATESGRISTSTISSGRGGNLTVNSSESIELVGSIENRLPPPAPRSQSPTPPPGPDLNQVTGILSTTFGTGATGNVNITTNSLRVIDTARIVSTTFDRGQAGNVNITTNQLTLTNGGTISSSNRRAGNAGNITINSDIIEIDGFNPINTDISSGIFAGSDNLTIGESGRIVINTSQLKLTNQALINTNTGGEGNAGDIVISADVVNLQDNGGIVSQARGASTGNGGDIDLYVNETLNLSNGGVISTRSEALGQAGDIRVSAKQIQLDRGEITATSLFTGGGNINLTANLLNMQNASVISTSVFDSIGGGGDITIDNDFVLARNDSQIEANAVEGPGGNITIFAQGIFLIDSSGIDASSELGVDGVIQVNQPEANPNQAEIELPSNIIDLQQLISKSCLSPSKKQQGRFVVRGTGGLPNQPNDLSDSTFETFSVLSDQTSSNFKTQDVQIPPLEAQGIYQMEDGRLVLGTECPAP
ncbi:MAG: filamentous hemagglutinin N-terminal domain-containing protein [Xenococcaceae cyanobacterium MO_207.B15]|nr:filamentous hemagglutinin N-terminal domain-containing protein [Xenococcaceae cyanobacterium MO_207.B15]